MPQPQLPWAGLAMNTGWRARKASTSSRLSPVTGAQSRWRKGSNRVLKRILSPKSAMWALSLYFTTSSLFRPRVR